MNHSRGRLEGWKSHETFQDNVTKIIDVVSVHIRFGQKVDCVCFAGRL
jgi:hypothetical protein